MKARVKATGEIVEVFFRGGIWISKHDCTKVWLPKELTDVSLNIEVESLPQNDGSVVYIDTTIDYWEKMKHQYAGMAMQGILCNEDYCKVLLDGIEVGSFAEKVSRASKDFATVLVEKLKSESNG